MVYKIIEVNSNEISKNYRYNLPKKDLKDLIPFFQFEGHYGGFIDGLKGRIGVFLTPYIYFPSSSRDQISNFIDNDFFNIKIKESDINGYFNRTSNLEEKFETDLTVGKHVTNTKWLLKEDKCKFLGISDERIDIEILVNDIPINVYFKTDVNIRILKKEDVINHLLELNPNHTFHIELDRNDFKFKDNIGGLMTKNKFTWIEFYMEFADKLLEYKDNRTLLIQKIKNSYESINFDLPTLERDEDGNNIIPYDIDPFTVFGLFNKKITDYNRKTILNGIKKEFSLKSEIPLDFMGVPIVNNLKATFYAFNGNRNDDDINNLWNLFESVLSYSDDLNEESKTKLINYYDKCIFQKGVGWNITMALFWVRPFDFISLDKKNRHFLSKDNNLSSDVGREIRLLKSSPPKCQKYLSICNLSHLAIENSSKYNTFAELSYQAYEIKDEENSSKDEGIGDDDVNKVNYWLFAPGEGAKMWEDFYKKGIMAIGWDAIKDLRNYDTKKEIMDDLIESYDFDKKPTNITLCLWQFANELKEGDVIFVKKGMNELVGRGEVQSNYQFNGGQRYSHIRKVKWTQKGSWPFGNASNRLPMKTLTNITNYKDFVNDIKIAIYGESIDDEPITQIYPEYTSEDFLNEVYISQDDYLTLEKLLLNKKNLIVQGAPGVGKTFMAKRLAYSIMGVKDVDRVMMVQFHQSYSYEDFVMGYRPSKDGFELREGSFYKFCKKAEDDDENDYFFIIDEINRGNLSKIFGELFMLIENDKRGEKNKIRLLYTDELFYIPKNVYIIGLMNTADRSLAMIDYALRRRFAFFDLKPGFSSEGFETYQSNINYSIFDSIIDVMEELNNAIKDDETLGEGFRIGHSYFCNLDEEDDVEEKLKYIVEYEIIPLLKEYWFDEPSKVEEWSNRLRNSFNE